MSYKDYRRNIKHVFGVMWKYQRKLYIFLMINIFFTAILPFPGIIVLKQIVNEFIGGNNYQYIVQLVLMMLVPTLIFELIVRFTDLYITQRLNKLEYTLFIDLSKKAASMDYYLLDDPVVQDKMMSATKCINGNNFVILIQAVKGLFSSILSIIFIFGLVTSLETIMLFIIYTLCVLIGAFINAKHKDIQYNIDTKIWPISRKMEWFLRFCGSPEYAKDVRLLKAQEFIHEKHQEYNKSYHSLLFDILKSKCTVDVYGYVVKFIQTLFFFLIVGYQIVVNNNLTVGDYTLLFAAFSTYTISFSNIIGGFTEIYNRARYFSHFMDYINVKSTFREGKRLLIEEKNNFTIEFENVSFKYPGRTEYAIKNVNIKINDLEKLAIVGENGSGKTTFIKLLCRLYDPTEGRILLNNVDIKDIDYAIYHDLFSVVFQDYMLFSFSFKENITLCDSALIKEEDVVNIANMVGLSDTMQHLPKGLDTIIFKNYDPEGVNLSGGESQKVAIARAMFKKHQIVILDEPTAALDAKSELLIYKNFNEISKDKIVFYISHRLASTRFCDYIILFANGDVAEFGSHDQLMHLHGMYKELYDAQASQYI